MGKTVYIIETFEITRQYITQIYVIKNMYNNYILWQDLRKKGGVR